RRADPLGARRLRQRHPHDHRRAAGDPRQRRGDGARGPARLLTGEDLMPLSDDEKQRLRDEEYFRAEIRKEIGGAKTAPDGAFRKLADFLETKVGFWFLTSVLATGVLTATTAVQAYFHRSETAAKERVEHARADTELVVKLSPMLLSDSDANKQVAFILLDG